MRVFAISDMHFDYDVNEHWVCNLSFIDFQDDLLILAGDISHEMNLLRKCISEFSKRFKKVLFVPGNHDLWISRNEFENSFEKFEYVCSIAEEEGVSIEPYIIPGLTIVPLFSWYDFSFGQPSMDLYKIWMDFKECIWPEDISMEKINRYFLNKNRNNLFFENDYIITFSHFLPRIDIMPNYIPLNFRMIYPVLGSNALDDQVRILKSNIHVYGHSHVNHQVHIDGVKYINNAFGTPGEFMHTEKKLLCIYEN